MSDCSFDISVKLGAVWIDAWQLILMSLGCATMHSVLTSRNDTERSNEGEFIVFALQLVVN